MSVGGLLAQMALGGTAGGATSLGQKLAEDAKLGRQKQILDQEFGQRKEVAKIEDDLAIKRQNAADERADKRTQKDFENRLLVADKEHQQSIDRQKQQNAWTLANQKPANELPAQTKALLDSYDDQLKGLSGAREAAIKAKNAELIKHYDDQIGAVNAQRIEILTGGAKGGGSEKPQQMPRLSSEEIDRLAAGAVPSSAHELIGKLQERGVHPGDIEMIKFRIDRKADVPTRTSSTEKAPGLLEGAKYGRSATGSAQPTYTDPMTRVDAERAAADSQRLEQARAKRKADPMTPIIDATEAARIAMRNHTIRGRLHEPGFNNALREIQEEFDLSDSQLQQVIQRAKSAQ